MVTIPLIEPMAITAGDSFAWKKVFADYPAPDWVLSYVFVNSTNKIAVTAGVVDDTAHLVNITAAVSATWMSGIYQWQAYVSNGIQRITVNTGQIEVKPNFSTVTTLDTRSEIKQTLDAITAVLKKRATVDQQEYQIGNRSLKLTPVDDLIKMRDKYAAMYRAEQAALGLNNGLASKNRLLVRF